ncbi:Astra associated protein 1 Asa1 [Candidozyma auris]|uniref:ASTRA-associated protein 1 n=2 Tax=Candidozyma auris TaxID=498019 RepID=A0A2H0ZVX5_CANAR|nr:astra-associated protein 1 [[Candida] auris]PIS54738.1 hypothetical protein B9J08_002518 [[Candida] auris]QWW25744.1 hypothetical protein CA7LBN_004648 [[Candida] auris]
MLSKHFSLRGHKAPIACFCKLQDKIASGDRDGWVVVWDLDVRRPLGFWKAHDGQIISMVDTELGLMTQGRDSAVRIWNLEELAAESDLSHMGSSSLPKPKCTEIPVNTLNFANVDYSDGLLATVSTTTSECFDIYALSGAGEKFALSRIVQAFSVGGGNGGSDETKRDGEGIIMKLRFVSSSLLFVGYESGTVKGFKLSDESTVSSSKSESLVLNKDLKVTEVFTYSGHNPQPVLSLEYDAEERKLYTGSASKKLIVVSIRDIQQVPASGDPREPEQSSKPSGLGALLGRPKIELLEDVKETMSFDISTHNLRHSGISSIQVGQYVHVVFWDGVIKTYTKSLEELDRLDRGMERIKVDDDNNDVSKPTSKALCLYLLPFEPVASGATSRKELLRLKRRRQGALLFVGYGDNLISAYNIDSV